MTKYLVILLSLIFIGCSGASLKQKEMFSNNKQIVSQGDTYSFANKIGPGFDKSNKNYKLEFTKFYGSETILNSTYNKTEPLSFKYFSKIKSGNFKFVIINSSNIIIKEIVGDHNKSVTVDLDKGRFRIKIIGNNASGKIELNLNK